jgi:hypothetical protein
MRKGERWEGGKGEKNRILLSVRIVVTLLRIRMMLREEK